MAEKENEQRAASCVAVRLTICHDSGYPLRPFPRPPPSDTYLFPFGRYAS